MRVPLAVKEGPLEPKTADFKAETGRISSWRPWPDTEPTAATVKHLLAVSAGLQHISITDRNPNSSPTLLRHRAATWNERLISWLKDGCFREDDHHRWAEKQRDTSPRGQSSFPTWSVLKEARRGCFCVYAVNETEKVWLSNNIINLESEAIRHRLRINPKWPFGINVKKKLWENEDREQKWRGSLGCSAIQFQLFVQFIFQKVRIIWLEPETLRLFTWKMSIQEVKNDKS